MSASQSQLSAARYGFDFVVATTQASINATMKEFLSGLSEPVVTVCYVADDSGNPTAIAYADLVKNANGSDPFTIPANADPTSDQDLKNLMAARFMMAFRAQLGLPPGLAPASVPDVVTLGGDTSSVGFDLLCSEFTVCELEPGGYSGATWFTTSQPSGAPWIFSSKVDLRMSAVDQDDYAKLPAAVQQQIKNLGADAFSVQQLLFDLDNAALETVPTISGVAPGSKLYMVLEQYFIGAYFTQMQSGGQPLVGCAITPAPTPSSTLVLTDLNMEVCPLLDGNDQPIPNPTQAQRDLATLNYLCAADGDALPPATTFAWNWVDADAAGQTDGIVALNRTTFANYLQGQLQDYVATNCFLPYVRVWLSGFLDADVNYSWNLTPEQTPTVTKPATGAQILAFHYDKDAEDAAGLDDDMGKMELHPSYDLGVSVSGSVMTVTQHLVVYLYVRSLQTSGDGNIVDLTLVDTYTLAVTQNGELESTLTSSRSDNSEDPSTNDFLNFFTDLNDIIDDVKNWVRGFAGTQLQDIPLSVLQDFVFPGGKTFAFKSVAFSDFADLTSEITYTDPS
jgi:hypothetical protein